MKQQKCAYCDWGVTVNHAGYLRLHYCGSGVCIGTGFVASRMSRLVARVAQVKLEALDRAGCLEERKKKANHL